MLRRILIRHVRRWHVEGRRSVVLLAVLFLLRLGMYEGGVFATVPPSGSVLGALLVPTCESAREAFT